MNGNTGIIILDLHGKNAYQARVMLDAALLRGGRGLYRLRVVHGYRGGQVLRQLVRQDYARHPRVLRVVAIDDGVTDLILRELF